MAQRDTSRAVKKKKQPAKPARQNAAGGMSSREEYLALLNEATHTILLSDNFDTTLNTLAVDIARLTRPRSRQRRFHSSTRWISRATPGKLPSPPLF